MFITVKGYIRDHLSRNSTYWNRRVAALLGRRACLSPSSVVFLCRKPISGQTPDAERERLRGLNTTFSRHHPSVAYRRLIGVEL